eukprot:271017_1
MPIQQEYILNGEMCPSIKFIIRRTMKNESKSLTRIDAKLYIEQTRIDAKLYIDEQIRIDAKLYIERSPVSNYLREPLFQYLHKTQANAFRNIDLLMDLLYRSMECCNYKYESNKDILCSLSFKNYNSENKEYILNGEMCQSLQTFGIGDEAAHYLSLAIDERIQMPNANIIIIGNAVCMKR